MNTKILQTLLALPGSQLARAANSLCGAAERTKVEAAQALASRISAGLCTLDDVRRSTHGVLPGRSLAPQAPAPQARPATLPVGGLAPTAPDPRVDAAAQVAARAEGEALKVASRLTVLDQEASLLKAQLSRVSSEVAIVNTAMANGLSSIRSEVAALRDSGPEVRSEIAAQVAAGLAPILAQATPETAPALVAATAAPKGQMSCANVFGVDLRDRAGRPVMVDVWADPEAEQIDPAYIWTDSLLRRLVLGQGSNLWLGGPKGTGKSEALRQFAARTGRRYVRINFRKYTSAEEYIGATGLAAGATSFQAGPFLRAYTHPGCVILLDEISNADPGELAPLNGLLEPRAAVSIGGSVWRRAAGVYIAAADNTLGTGDQSGRYAGTRGMNSALMDRFGLVSRMDYLPRSLEVDALVRHAGCAQALAEHVMDCIATCRAKVDSGEIIDAPSIRSAVAFIRALALMDPAEAWADTIVARQPVESHPALAAVYTACINADTIEAAL